MPANGKVRRSSSNCRKVSLGELMSQSNIILVYTTWPDTSSAEAAGRKLVATKAAACVNILAPATAVFMWQGSVESGSEVPMIIKTVSDRLREVTQIVDELHPYDVPAVVAVPVIGGSEAFCEWIKAETTSVDTPDEN